MNKITFFDSPWFAQEFGDKLKERYLTQRIGLNILNQISTNPFILETGTIRMENDWGAGMSTLVFSRYVTHHGGHIVTNDISYRIMDVCKKVTDQYSNFITYVIEDSLVYLPTVQEKIDFLYLDSMDCPPIGDASMAQDHNLKEFLICEKLLNDRAVIMIDDVGFENGGKGAKTHEYLNNQGYVMIMKHQQSVWLK
jgi:predicted O-methyltransferase YrrM